ncbi:MAG: ABC transporter ATP-binding protein, partial [Betaproteobacteria bacterium]|nr:ABC transporter ATP-binding protein [Betaproteobacteria bacterium]MBE8158928.1 ABC transporter ATP-binding protein [Betaproteobacteria bacterium]
VLDEGKLIAEGAPDTLAQTCPFYAELLRAPPAEESPSN